MDRRCTKCGEVKAVSEFSKDARGRDGRRSWCKACLCAQQRAYREANPEKVRVYNKAYREANRGKACARQKAYREANREKLHARSKAYREANPGKVEAIQKAWREANPEKLRAVRKAWREANPEKLRAVRKAWREANPEKLRAVRAKRRARKNGAAGQASIEQMTARWDYYGGLCYICGMPAEAVDHVVPLAKGGSNWPANLRPICGSCNSVKGPKWPYDFEQARLEATT